MAPRTPSYPAATTKRFIEMFPCTFCGQQRSPCNVARIHCCHVCLRPALYSVRHTYCTIRLRGTRSAAATTCPTHSYNHLSPRLPHPPTVERVGLQNHCFQRLLRSIHTIRRTKHPGTSALIENFCLTCRCRSVLTYWSGINGVIVNSR